MGYKLGAKMERR